MNKVAIFLTALLALVGLVAIVYALAPGVGVSPDSAVYIASAGSLLNGDGLSIPTGMSDPLPMTHFGPFYPTVLAILGLSGLHLHQIATWVNILLFPLTIFLVSFILSHSNKEHFLLGPLACLPILFSEDLLLIYSYAWSEPLFLFICLLGLFLFAKFLVEPKPFGWALSIGLLSLAFLTRYAGAAIIPTIFLGVLFSQSGTLNRRIMQALTLSFTCALPSSIWFIRNMTVAGNPSDRGLAYHPMTAKHIQDGLETISKWFLPGRITGTIRDVMAIAFLLGILILVVIGLVKNKEKSSSQGNWSTEYMVSSIFFIFCISYLLVLILTIFFFDAQAGFNYRLLAPILISGIITIFSILPSYLRRISWPIQLALGLIFLLVITFNAVHAIKFISRSHAGSLKMYAGDGWQKAEIIAAVRALPDGMPIYSNGDDAIYFVAGKPAARFPQKSSPFTLRENPDYRREVEQMQSALRDRGGFVICFAGITWRGYLPDCEELKELLPMELLWEGKEGWIYLAESE